LEHRPRTVPTICGKNHEGDNQAIRTLGDQCNVSVVIDFVTVVQLNGEDNFTNKNMKRQSEVLQRQFVSG